MCTWLSRLSLIRNASSRVNCQGEIRFWMANSKGVWRNVLSPAGFTVYVKDFLLTKPMGSAIYKVDFHTRKSAKHKEWFLVQNNPVVLTMNKKDCWIDPFIQSFSNVLFSENLLLILKQDFSNPEADCPNLFDFEAEESISFNQDKDPANVHLYSNAAELVHLRNEENKFNFVVSYPLTSRSLKWTQASDPFLTSSVQGFEDFTSEVEMCVFLNFLTVKILKLNICSSPKQQH